MSPKGVPSEPAAAPKHRVTCQNKCKDHRQTSGQWRGSSKMHQIASKKSQKTIKLQSRPQKNVGRAKIELIGSRLAFLDAKTYLGDVLEHAGHCYVFRIYHCELAKK